VSAVQIAAATIAEYGKHLKVNTSDSHLLELTDANHNFQKGTKAKPLLVILSLLMNLGRFM